MYRKTKLRIAALGVSVCMLCGGALAAEPVNSAATGESTQSCQLAASTTVYVTETLRVRAEPNTNAAVLGTLTKGTAVTVTAQKDGWYTLDFGGKTGYISVKYTTTLNPTPTTVYAADTVQVYAKPGTDGAVLGTLAKGAAIDTYALADGWYTIQFNGQTAYISAQATTTTNPNVTTVYTTENLKVRLEPNTTSKVLGTIKKGTAVETYALDNGWYTIKYNGGTAYINAKYTTTTKPGTTTTTYTDVAANAWYAQYVQYVSEKGLMTGTSKTTFGPKVTLSRAPGSQQHHRRRYLPMSRRAHGILTPFSGRARKILSRAPETDNSSRVQRSRGNSSLSCCMPRRDVRRLQVT